MRPHLRRPRLLNRQNKRQSVARPKLKIDADQVEKLAAINCSYAEMAAVLDCDESTLTRRYAQAIKKGRERGRMSLKRKQYELAMSGNVTMLIWLGKIMLEQREPARPVELTGPGGGAIDVNAGADRELVQFFINAIPAYAKEQG